MSSAAILTNAAGVFLDPASARSAMPRRPGHHSHRRKPAHGTPPSAVATPHRRVVKDANVVERNDQIADPDTDPAAADFLERLRAGDDKACAVLVQRYGGRMLVTARRIVRDEDTAADCVQDAFLSAFRTIDRFEARADLGTWLHRITVNAALMRLRKRNRRPEQSIEDLLPQFDEDGVRVGPTEDTSDSAEELIQRAGVRDSVRAAIDQLPESLRTIIILRDIEDLSTEEAAAKLGIGIGAAKTRLHRARLALKALLLPVFEEISR